MSSELEFENQAFVELLSEDGLIILARGLGLDRLFLKFLKLYSDPHNLVLVLNASSSQEYFLTSLSGDLLESPPKTINNEFSVKDREQIYLQGGVLFITSRILVVDLLRKYCPVEKVSGILVYNAHRLVSERSPLVHHLFRVLESSTEAFIMMLYRQANKAGFIKAFSDAPEPLAGKFSQLERVMRSLFLRNLYLWPRFHASVSASLSQHKPDVVELRQQMSPSMTAIQMAILDIIKACINELKRYNASLDTDEVTVENSLSKSFDQTIKMQLDPIWNQLGSKSKQLIFDLRMLRTLLYYLTQYDSVTFYSYLDTIRTSDEKRAFSSDSTWAFMDASNILFAKAKERVYGSRGLSEAKKTRGEDVSGPEGLLLEESPKWHLLSMVLDEIRKESKSDESEGRKILVLTNDERTCYQLKEYLCCGGHKLLERQFLRLVAAKLQDGAECPVKGPSRGKSGPAGASSRKRETNIKKEAKVEVPFKRRRTERAAKASPREELEGEARKYEEIEQEFSQDLLEAETMLFQGATEIGSRGTAGGVGGGLMRPACPQDSPYGLLPEPVVVLHSLRSSETLYHLTKLLVELRPRYIIMYDSDVHCVRQIEVFKASNPGMPLRVYFLLYDSSVEEQKYLTSLRKEKEAFHALIREKAHMVVPVDQEGKVGDCSLLRRDLSSSASQEPVSSRKAGGRKVKKGTQTVLVDIREFRSALPFLLYKRGIQITPLTLEVGDYILSPDICVERKSISDLIGSLNSGRLFNQVTAMTRHYKKPVLLIEFDENQSFSLQSKASLHSDISAQSVSSKLVLLTLHFPDLRILWCRSPHATAELFEELKQGQSEPEADVAMEIGQDSLASLQNTTYSATAQDFLLKLPGINSKNYRQVMEKVTDLRELVSLSEEALDSILGNVANAGLLWGFLHNKLSSQTTRDTLKARP